MKIIENGTITDVKGIKATGISAKLKKSGKKENFFQSLLLP